MKALFEIGAAVFVVVSGLFDFVFSALFSALMMVGLAWLAWQGIKWLF